MSQDKDNKAPAAKTPAMPERKALGRGLAALMGENMPLPSQSAGAMIDPEVPTIPLPAEEKVPTQRVVEKVLTPKPVERVVEKVVEKVVDRVVDTGFKVAIEQVEPNPEQPRKVFNEAKLTDLALSIKEQGIIQPISVIRVAKDKYQIVAGERRWRAARLAGLAKIPIIVREQPNASKDHDLASLIENIQREDLSPMELARAYDRLLKTGVFTQELLAKKLGLSRVVVANCVRLLKLPADVAELVDRKRLSEGHARVLLSIENPAQLSELAARVVEMGLSVRETEEKVRQLLSEKAKNPSSGLSLGGFGGSQKTPAFEALENEFRQIFGTKVLLKGKESKGTMEVHFQGADALHRIIGVLRNLKKEA